MCRAWVSGCPGIQACGSSHSSSRCSPLPLLSSPAPCRRKNDPLDFVALMEGQVWSDSRVHLLAFVGHACTLAAAHLPGTSCHTHSQEVEVPQFDLLPSKRGKDEKGKAKKGRGRRAKATAKTLLPEDHHYNVRRAGWAVEVPCAGRRIAHPATTTVFACKPAPCSAVQCTTSPPALSAVHQT